MRSWLSFGDPSGHAGSPRFRGLLGGNPQACAPRPARQWGPPTSAFGEIGHHCGWRGLQLGSCLAFHDPRTLPSVGAANGKTPWCTATFSVKIFLIRSSVIGSFLCAASAFWSESDCKFCLPAFSQGKLMLVLWRKGRNLVCISWVCNITHHVTGVHTYWKEGGTCHNRNMEGCCEITCVRESIPGKASLKKSTRSGQDHLSSTCFSWVSSRMNGNIGTVCTLASWVYGVSIERERESRAQTTEDLIKLPILIQQVWDGGLRLGISNKLPGDVEAAAVVHRLHFK
ncbi:uncharacterized protein LOC122211537 [Panthera leo]|uniref:uncharacterized protein LOC122211537 n=1 Tax=Panthera leo TaxID=9689 RepID=UPI001C6A82B4|nr:uncharacterized protein LOC122211537 [Panthera leo]